MRNSLVAFLLFLLGWECWATTVGCSDHFLLPTLNLSYCEDGCPSDTEMLYHRGLTEALDAYITKRRDAGALAAKKFEIKLVPGAAEAGPGIDLSQGLNGYYIYVSYGASWSPAHDLRQFVQLVDYFGHKDWRPFTGDFKSSNSVLARILGRAVGQPDMSFFEGRSSVVSEVGEVQVVYENDRLVYWLAGRRLDLQPADPIPVQIGNRYLLGSTTGIHVYENGSEVGRAPIKCALPPTRAMAFRRWVNIGCGGNAWLTYSYERNRFYEVDRYAPELGRSCGDDPIANKVHPTPFRVTREQ